MGHDQWLYMNIVVYDQGEDGILQNKEMVLKSKTRIQMDMVWRGILPEETKSSSNSGATYGGTYAIFSEMIKI